MKKMLVLLLALAAVFPLAAQDRGLNSMSLNGATGIYVVPTAKISFRDDNMGFIAGYHTNYFTPSGGDAELNHLIQVNFSFFKMLEVSGSFDLQPDNPGKDSNDILTGIKLQLPFGSVPIAIGGSIQYINMNESSDDHLLFQVYGAITYESELFGWPAETTLVIGHTFGKINHTNTGSNIDFGMGFDLIVFPNQLNNFLHILIDFANFSYSANPWGVDARIRGVLNTGLRIDLSQIPALNKFTFAIDAFIADAFDSTSRNASGRSFGLGVTFGMSI